AVIEQHDALRLRFIENAGQWHAEHQPVSDAPVLWQVHVSSMDPCTALFTDAQRSLDLEAGPLLRALLVDGPEGQQRLFIAIHHLVVDGVSWR
ncbi:condensation domain-containing protein, partial [Pseudomonas sp. SIMBA_044]